MISRTKKINFILIMVLLLTGLFAGIAHAQNCPGYRVYVDTANGSDQGEGTSSSPFATIDKAVRVAKTTCGGAIVSVDGSFEFVVGIPPTEGTGIPVAESLLIGGLILLAIILIGSALLLRRRSATLSHR